MIASMPSPLELVICSVPVLVLVILWLVFFRRKSVRMGYLQVAMIILLVSAGFTALMNWFNAINNSPDWRSSSDEISNSWGAMVGWNTLGLAGLICSVISWRKKQKRGLVFVVAFVLLCVVHSASLFYG